MKRKLIGVLICMLFLISGFSISISAITINKNQKQFDREYSTTGIASPLELSIQAEKLCDRVWIIKAFAKNTWDTTVHVKWGNKPVTMAAFYIIPDVMLYAINPIGREHFLIDRQFNIGSNEEKLVYWGLFHGISNMILYGFKNDYTEYIPSWPILPEADYKVQATLNPYYVDGQFFDPFQHDDLIFQYS